LPLKVGDACSSQIRLSDNFGHSNDFPQRSLAKRPDREKAATGLASPSNNLAAPLYQDSEAVTISDS
jgi:hypothetical protein